jgi:hypothetical protein
MQLQDSSEKGKGWAGGKEGETASGERWRVLSHGLFLKLGKHTANSLWRSSGAHKITPSSPYYHSGYHSIEAARLRGCEQGSRPEAIALNRIQ